MSESFDFTGQLEPGQTLEVNAETMEVSINGDEQYKNFDGDLISLLTGDNTITYTDSELSRTVEIEVVRKDRHV